MDQPEQERLNNMHSKRMEGFAILVIVLLGLFHVSACDTNGDQDPDLVGSWIASTALPDVPFILNISYKMEISNNGILGTGSYDLWVEDSVLYSVDLDITGTYDYPSVVLQLTSEDSRSDTFVGELNSLGSAIPGVMMMPPLIVPDIFFGTQLTFLIAGTTDPEMTFTRVSD